MLSLDVSADRTPDIADLVMRHHQWAVAVTPPGHVHAIDPASAPDPDTTWITARVDGQLVGICALVPVDVDLVELKAMHVTPSRRGCGLGRQLLDAAIAAARRDGYRAIVLETGTYEAFEPARRLYAQRGFVPRPPFGSYSASPVSVCMELDLVTGSPVRTSSG